MTSTSDQVRPTHHHYIWNEDIIDELQIELTKIETLLNRRMEVVEKLMNFPPGEETTPPAGSPLLQTTQKILFMLKRYIHAEDALTKENNSLKKQLKRHLKECEMERDILLQQVHAHLETNSSLRVRLEEQRCQTGTIQSQLNKDLEARIKVLESEKEELSEMNLEKDQNIRKMTHTLEETIKALKEKETEVLNLTNKEGSLRADFQKILEEKTMTEEKYMMMKQHFQDFAASTKGLGDRKSLSVGDLRRSLSFIETKASPKSNNEFFSTLELFKTSEGIWKSKVKPTPVQSQLNSLRRDLLQVTRKLEALKLQLVSSGVIPEDKQPPKNLKRKANPVEEVSDDQKSEFRDLKHILQDAKNLNAKLQNLREEKQRLIEDKGGVELNKKEGGVDDKENEFGQTAHPTGIFKAR